jgi:hypothetical protein
MRPILDHIYEGFVNTQGYGFSLRGFLQYFQQHKQTINEHKFALMHKNV